MTKTIKAVIFFIDMRIAFKYAFGQSRPVKSINNKKTFFNKFVLALLCVFFMCACINKNDESPVIPPVTSPLSGDYIGFGVITASFTHVTAEPSTDSPSVGYLRRGSLVKILKRQTVRTGGNFTSWVMTEGAAYGWLKEDVLEIYDNENRAKTASESLAK